MDRKWTDLVSLLYHSLYVWLPKSTIRANIGTLHNDSIQKVILHQTHLTVWKRSKTIYPRGDAVPSSPIWWTCVAHRCIRDAALSQRQASLPSARWHRNTYSTGSCSHHDFWKEAFLLSSSKVFSECHPAASCWGEANSPKSELLTSKLSK